MSDEEASGPEDLGVPWPKVGDRAFAQAARPVDGVNFALNGLGKSWKMMDGYKMAGDHLVERALANFGERDRLVFPILFTYRHFIELSLKVLIDRFGPGHGVPANWNTHKLMELWGLLRATFLAHGFEKPGEEEAVVEAIISEFDHLDPLSSSFRYPRDRHGEPLLLPRDEFDLRRLAEAMQKLESYFMACDGFLDAAANAGG